MREASRRSASSKLTPLRDRINATALSFAEH
jgi:hypothetical protein